jgi:hypothetical protein
VIVVVPLTSMLSVTRLSPSNVVVVVRPSASWDCT